MTDYEKLGEFYLGGLYDLEKRESKPGMLLYDSKDLVTHGVCFGMTGSGKTGLCTVLLEEAAMDGIPALIVDPKGDMGNLLLTFPELKAGDFEPWVAPEEAARKGMTAAEFAKNRSELWRKGLKQWGQDGERIRKLKGKAEFTIYTPGSQAGVPLSVLKSFDAPPVELREDRELMRDAVNGAASSLLGLAGMAADDMNSREHILIAQILSHNWNQGKNVDLPALIRQIQEPPVERVGVLDLDSFYPAKERFSLAMAVNSLLASPGFEVWLEGEPLDIDRLLYTPEGKARVSVLSIAHLNDAERMFFVSRLLNQVVAWMRRQPGTTSLRALLYMDEIFGYFPPTANPPSKTPLLTLLKQARAYGLGVMLATQNPVDLDYKGLGNTGTWMIGKLQTDRDQKRVLDGLAGAAMGAGTEFDRSKMEATLAALGNRVFLMYNVHEDGPEIFQTRFAMSYLAGPMTRTQISRLMAGRKAAVPAMVAARKEMPSRSQRPILAKGVPEVFVPVEGEPFGDVELVYEPYAVGCAEVRFSDTRKNIEAERTVNVLAPLQDGPVVLDWDGSEALAMEAEHLLAEPEGEADYGEIPDEAEVKTQWTKYKTAYKNWIYAEKRLPLFRHVKLKLVSEPGEEEQDFRVRVSMAAHEQRDLAVEKLRAKYATKIARIEERVRKAEQKIDKEKAQASREKWQGVVSVGSTILGALFGRKIASATNVRKAGTAMRAMGRASAQKADVERAKEDLAALQESLAELNVELEGELEELAAKYEEMAEAVEDLAVRPKKADIRVELVALAWAPFWRDSRGMVKGAWGRGRGRG